MLVKHAETARAWVLPPENMLIIEWRCGGSFWSGIRVAGKVQAGVELVDTSSSGMVSGKVLKEQRLAEEGITVAAAVDWNGKL